MPCVSATRLFLLAGVPLSLCRAWVVNMKNECDMFAMLVLRSWSANFLLSFLSLVASIVAGLCPWIPLM